MDLEICRLKILRKNAFLKMGCTLCRIAHVSIDERKYCGFENISKKMV